MSEVVDDDDDKTLQRVLLIASVATFSCLIILSMSSIVVTVRHFRKSHHQTTLIKGLPAFRVSPREHQVTKDCAYKSGCCWKLVVGVFVTLRVIYSFTLTFNGVMTTCRLVARESMMNFVTGEESITAAMTATTSPLVRRLAELERLGGLSSLQVGDDTLHQEHSSVSACGHYVDDLLSSTAVQIAQGPGHIQTSYAVDRLQHIRRNFLINVTEYVQSRNAQFDTVVAQPAVENARRRLNNLLDNDWLHYSRYLFQVASSSSYETTSTNHSAVRTRSAQFAAFLEAASELNAAERWTAALGKRYIVYRPIVNICLSIFSV